MWTGMVRLKKHTDKVTCILYPHSEHPRYDPGMLVTGSRDFSIILWNINTGEMVHRFVVQTGEILQLSVPPNTVNVSSLTPSIIDGVFLWSA